MIKIPIFNLWTWRYLYFQSIEVHLPLCFTRRKKDLKPQHFKITQEQMGPTRSEMAEKS